MKAELCPPKPPLRAERRHVEVLTTIRDAMEITHLRERIARLEAERERKPQHPA